MHKVLIVEADLYPNASDTLSSTTKMVLEQNGIDYERIKVPGIFEIPAAVSIALDAYDYDGAIVLGYISGKISPTLKTRYEECARGINDIAIHFSLPIGFGIFIAEDEDNISELSDRFGKQATLSCLELIKIKNLYQTFHNDSGSGYKN